jgi:PEP-CTERM motif-containing protein
MLRRIRPLPFLATAALGLAIVAGIDAGSARAGLIGPVLPYTSFADSPFNGVSFTYFHLETFEEGSLTAPGVSASAGTVLGPGSLIDSVDGGGNNGHSFFSGDGLAGITFTFDPNVLGQLPTHAGIAWTDGELAVHFSAKDSQGNSLGTIDDSSGHGFSGGDGDPSNYRFFGAIDPNGISSITISNDSGGIEVDHLQYGLASVPEPGSLSLLALGLTGVGWLQSRRRTFPAH